MFTDTTPDLAELGTRIGLDLHSAGVQVAATPTVTTDADTVTVTVPVAGGDPLRSVSPHLDALLTATSTLRVTGTSVQGDHAVVTLSSAPMVSTPTLLGDVESFTVGGASGWHGMVTHYRAQGAVARAKPIANTSVVGRKVLNPLAMTAPLRPLADTARATPASDAAPYLPYLARLLDADVYRSVMKDAGVGDASTVPVVGDAKVTKLIGTVLPTLQHAHVGPRGLELIFAANPTGTSLSDWEKGVPHLAAALGVDPSNATVRSLPDGRIVFSTGDRDPLSGVALPTTVETVPTAPDTLYIGVREDGSDAVLHLPESPSLLVSGLSGTGKSAAVISMLAPLIATRATVLTVASGKDAADLDPIGNAATTYIVGSGVEEREALTAALDGVMDEVSRRSRTFRADHGTANYWAVPEASRPALYVVVVDEAHRFLTGTASSKEGKAAAPLRERLMELVTAGRSLGVLTVLVTQRPSHKALDADLRENITSAIALRQSTTTARMSLGEGEPWRDDPRLDPSRLPVATKGRAVATCGSGDQPLARVQLLHLSDAEIHTAVATATQTAEGSAA